MKEAKEGFETHPVKCKIYWLSVSGRLYPTPVCGLPQQSAIPPGPKFRKKGGALGAPPKVFPGARAPLFWVLVRG